MSEKYCQSCGMPMEGQEFGTNADGSRSEDYCGYCWANGKFTADCSMEEMIDFCVGPMTENGRMTADQARGMMRDFFPQLKRWKQA